MCAPDWASTGWCGFYLIIFVFNMKVIRICTKVLYNLSFLLWRTFGIYKEKITILEHSLFKNIS